MQAHRPSVLAFVASLLVLACFVQGAQQGKEAKALAEADLLKLIELQIDDEAVIARIQKQGIGFTADADALDRLKEAGASEAVLKAIEQAGAAAPAGGEPKRQRAAVSYQDVVNLLELGIDEAAILKRLAASPTKFVLDATQTAELKGLGASDRLLNAMKSGAASTAAQTTNVTDLAILLDCSGSMQEKTPDGQTKMEVAKKAVTELVQRVPNGLKVMFVIYGHDKAQECKAVKVVRPMSAIDAAGKAELSKVIAAVKPVGGTPIALALRTTGEALAKSAGPAGAAGAIAIVLISDGKESCKGDPAAEAAMLVENPKLGGGVTVIGFGVQGEERASLEQIAASGKGKYYDAQDAAGLDVAVKKVEPAGKRRAVRVAAPTMELPPLAKLVLTEAGTPGPAENFHKPLAEAKDYDTDLRLPSAEEYDIWWVPQEGLPIRMISKISIADRKRVDATPEEHLGVVVVSGEGMPEPKVVALVEPGSPGPGVNFYEPVQEVDKYGAPMVVAAGTYDLWMQAVDSTVPETLEKKLEVPAGEVTTIE